jgi:hypothetical protein
MALIIFIKNPALGKVKTRLAATLGQAAALNIYHKLSAHTRSVALQVPHSRYLYYSDFVDPNDEWDNALFVKKIQAGHDLGERMQRAFAEVLRVAPKAVIIGSDCPLLTPALVQEALDQLNEYPYVLGPASDGGYYLLGMREASPHLFTAIEWSTDQVAATTLGRIAELEKTCFILPTLPDIDVEEDWKKYGW